MRFALTEDQVALRDGVRELLAARCAPAVVRSAWPGGDPAAVDALWAELTAMGVVGAAAPAEHGGLGLTETDLVPLLEELGHAGVPLPVAETAAVAVPLLAGAGDPHGQLAGILTGTSRVALVTGNGPTWYGERAGLALVLRDGAARLVAPTDAEPVSTVDGSLAAARLTLPDGGLLSDDPQVVGLAVDRAALATAAQLVGLSRRMLEMTVGYVKTRRQFGAPIGSFQAVKHQLADALLRLEFAAPAVLAGAWALERRTVDRARDVSVAVVLAGEAARSVARTAIQCHGAIGYTVEYDLHLYAKRTWALAAAAGIGAHLDLLAESLLDKEGQ